MKYLIWVPGLFWLFLHRSYDDYFVKVAFVHGIYTGVQIALILCMIFWLIV